MDVAAFKASAAGPGSSEPDSDASVLSFHRLRPLPSDLVKAGDEEAQHLWEEEHWGCRYGAVESELTADVPGRLNYRFESKWAPPLRFLRAMGTRWPTLTFSLFSSEYCGGYLDFLRVEGSRVDWQEFRCWLREQLLSTTRPGYPATTVGEGEVIAWCDRGRLAGAKSILCLLDQSELAYYDGVPGGLRDWYRRQGFAVVHCPVENGSSLPVSDAVLAACAAAFAAAEKPLLVHGSNRGPGTRVAAVTAHLEVQI